MNRFIIESPHLAKDCDRAVKDIHAAGYLHQFEWGCDDNDHTGWAIVEAENADEVKQMIPWYLREKARIVKLVKYDLAEKNHD